MKGAKMIRETERFSSYMTTHVFKRVLLEIYDKQGDETYKLDMPPDVYEELKKTITDFEMLYNKE